MTGYARAVLTVAAAGALAAVMLAQPPQGPPGGAKGGGGQKGGVAAKGKAGPGAAANAKAQAPIDLTGNWVSLVTEDWVYRIAPAPKNAKGKADTQSVPLSGAGTQAANAWDPAKDEAAGETCKAYGAAGLMRMPTHLQIDWADDNTLRIQTTAGTQTRLMKFTGDLTGPASLQGNSKATWEGMGGGGRGRGAPPAGAPGAAAIRAGSMKVVTTNMSGGYLRRNGVPYSASAVLTEYYDVLHEPNGDLYLLVTTQVEDPVNLSGIFRTSSHFKKEADASKFKPTPCSAR